MRCASPLHNIRMGDLHQYVLYVVFNQETKNLTTSTKNMLSSTDVQ